MKAFSNTARIIVATLGACFFYGALAEVEFDGPSPHPGLHDEALKEALRKDWDHKPMSYWKARKAVFSGVDGNGKEAECVYTGEKLSYSAGVPNPRYAQLEHTWPPSKNLPEAAKTDLHHVFPILPEANIARMNFQFGKVFVKGAWERGGSKVGVSRDKKVVFEVRPEQRGDTARAMFYISTMHNLPISESEEKTLRIWHKGDPVDAAERARNKRIAKLQKSSNPFVTHPALAKRISDF